MAMLTNGKETTTKILAQRFYKPARIPHNGQIIVTSVVRSLEKKTARNSPYKVRLGHRVGPFPMTVKLEKVS